MPSRQAQILPPPDGSVVPLALEDFPSPSSAELVVLPGGLYQGVPEVGVSLKWTSRDIDNISPFLSKEEVEQLGHLTGILSSSKTI
ncbi:hypothetical protein BHM03_00040101 [Ensete ventricosum]|nr:hypothetical protein BHM03_00040101 [Ensete ventricosum]